MRQVSLEMNLMISECQVTTCKESLFNWVMLIRKFLSMKTRLLYSHRKLRDWIALLKRKILKLPVWGKRWKKLVIWINPLEVFRLKLCDWLIKTLQCKMKWDKLNKIWDFQPIRMPRWWNKSLSIKNLLIKTIQKMTESSKECKNLSQRILI